jgi:hypothetical protein
MTLTMSSQVGPMGGRTSARMGNLPRGRWRVPVDYCKSYDSGFSLLSSEAPCGGPFLTQVRWS